MRWTRSFDKLNFYNKKRRVSRKFEELKQRYADNRSKSVENQEKLNQLLKKIDVLVQELRESGIHLVEIKNCI